MPSPYNITNIPAPRVDFIDPRTGLMAREWYRFFFNLFNLTGAGTTDTSLADLQVGPPAVNDLLGELGITYDQAQLAAMMAQYEQSIRDVINQIETTPAFPQLGTMAQLQQAWLPWVTFDTAPEFTPPTVGTVAWDGGTTLNVQMTPNVLGRVNESAYYYIKASSAITKGEVVMFAGAVGSSGVPTGAPATGVTDGSYIMGVAAESIALNSFGLVQFLGTLKGVNTSAYVDGDILWYNPAVTGGLTKTKPTAPNIKVQMAAVISAGSGGSGSILIRVSAGSVLGGTDSNVEFGTLANKDLIQYDSVAQYWKNVSPSTISIGTATNLAGGAAGSVPYQTGSNTTTFLSIGSAGQYARVNAGATAPEWASPAALTKTDDTNVTLTLGGSASTALLNAASITVGWTGTLAASRLNANVVQAVTNDTNVTGSIATQTLTLSWSGQLAVSRGGTGTGTAFTTGSVIFAGTSGVYSQNNAQFFWDNTNNRLGIGNAAPTVTLDVTGAAAFSTSATTPVVIGGTGTTSTLTLRSTSGIGATGADIVFQVGNNGATEAMRALNSGVVCVGTNTATNNARLNQKLAIVSTGAGNYGGAAITTYGGTTADISSVIDLVRSRGTTDGSFTAVASGDRLGYIVWRGADGSAFQNAASIRAEVDGTPGAGSMPGRLILMTTPSGSAASLERLRIDASGNVLVTGVGGLGYGTGSGGAVTQATSRTTGVTLDKTNGAITLVSAAGTTTWQTFTVTNNKVAATDTIIVNQKSGTDLYQIFVTNVAAGSFKITFATTGGTTTEQPVFNFAVIKAVTA